MTVLLATTPASAISPVFSKPQEAALKIINFEILNHAMTWGHPQGGLEQAVLDKLLDQQPILLKAECLKTCWPYDATGHGPVEPPGGALLFSHDIVDLQGKTPTAFTIQFNRYLGSLGAREEGQYPYLTASQMPATGTDAIGDELFRLYGGEKTLWRMAATRALQGIQALVTRAYDILVLHLNQEVTALKAVPAPDATTRYIAKTLSELPKAMEGKPVDIRIKLMSNAIHPLATELAKPQGKK
jgi:hypothetical protein